MNWTRNFAVWLLALLPTLCACTSQNDDESVWLSPKEPQMGHVVLQTTSDFPLTLRLGDVESAPDALHTVHKSVSVSEPGAATWYEGVSQAGFHGSRLDQVFTMGWNLRPDGRRVDNTDAAIGDQWESYFQENAQSTWLERHWVFINNDGTYQRPLSCQMQRADTQQTAGFTNCFVAADYFAIAPHTLGESPSFTFQSPAFAGASFFGVTHAATVRLLTNNAAQLLQQNAAGDRLVSLAYLDARDTVRIGQAGQPGVALDGETTTIAGSLRLAKAFASYEGPPTNVPPSPWVSLTILAGWQTFDASSNYPQPSYFKDSNGVVHLKGRVSRLSNGAIGQLPEGYRPAENLLMANASDAAPSHLEVTSDGVLIQHGMPSWASLDGVTFLAER